MTYLTQTHPVRGKNRLVSFFHGTVGKIDATEVGVLFDEQSPRIFVVMHFPTAKASDPTFQALINEVIARKLAIRIPTNLTGDEDLRAAGRDPV